MIGAGLVAANNWLKKKFASWLRKIHGQNRYYRRGSKIVDLEGKPHFDIETPHAWDLEWHQSPKPGIGSWEKATNLPRPATWKDLLDVLWWLLL